MGSICAMSATGRLSEVLEKIALKKFKEEMVGKVIEDVVIDCEDMYNINMFLKLSDGSWVEGPKLAEYVEDDGDVDGCTVYGSAQVSVDEIKAEYRALGWTERLDEEDADGGEDPLEG